MMFRSRWRFVEAVLRRDDGQSQRGKQRRSCGQYTADSPHPSHCLRFLPIRPEQIEEECCAEDGSDKRTDEDVV